MKRGEVRWYNFKPPDNKRPVVILTRNSILDYLGEVTVVPITSTMKELTYGHNYQEKGKRSD
jgi:mRNA interferase MazF